MMKKTASVVAAGLGLVSAVGAAFSQEQCFPALETRPIAATADTILAMGFTVTLEVDFDGVKDDETLYEAGPVKLAFRLAGKTPITSDASLTHGINCYTFRLHFAPVIGSP